MLTSEEANRYKVGALGISVSVSPNYVAGSHDLCVLELFKKSKREIKKHCQSIAQLYYLHPLGYQMGFG